MSTSIVEAIPLVKVEVEHRVLDPKLLSDSRKDKPEDVKTTTTSKTFPQQWGAQCFQITGFKDFEATPNPVGTMRLRTILSLIRLQARSEERNPYQCLTI